MRQKSETRKSHGEKVVKDIRRATCKQYSAEEKIRIVLDGLHRPGPLHLALKLPPEAPALSTGAIPA